MDNSFYMNDFGGPGFMFQIFPIIFFIIFAIVIGGFIITAVKGVGTWHKNNNSPVLTVAATVVTKRTNVTHHHHNTGNDSMGHTSSSTWYYATFEVESGDRMELGISGTEFGMLVEGDTGRLTFQGTRFLKFERN
ncbi:uncharacterized protein DUF2500 [Mobilisporobacter senegalensis]|uniref:Uncharacterized protein DUF2500 n=1 Tax=Mobilisporobacter senegalensis TaxID=1329262 RepID=A0A3N1XN69_9FIRM|nr:DUF2500 domain-containing protein [Mobilisporobacter senegalensis]ROR28143.1 uncharacterized protein DUF2500 [Mobilisporobacter senegalensis]